MSQNLFVFYILILAGGMNQIYFVFLNHFNNSDVYLSEVSMLQKKIGQEKFLRSLAQMQLDEFKQDVAKILPEVLKKRGQGEKGYPLRGLASVVFNKDNDDRLVDLSNRLFFKAKRQFRNKNYVASGKNFDLFIRNYSFSLKLSEAYFLKTESLYSQKEFAGCIETVEEMVSLFPANELTGFALLRMGKIYEFQGRHEEASSIYETVIRTFGNKQLALQARKSLALVEL